MDGGTGGTNVSVHFCFKSKSHHQLAGDFTAPLFDSALESAQLPWRESADHAFLQTEEKLFSIGVRLFVEPLLNLRPDCFKWVHTSAISSWPAASLSMCRLFVNFFQPSFKLL